MEGARLLSLNQAKQISDDVFMSFESHFTKWQIIADIISPSRFSRNPYSFGDGPSNKAQIVSSYPAQTWSVFKAGVTNGVSPKNRKWFTYESDDPNLRRDHQVKQLMANRVEVNESLLRKSNYYRLMPEVNGDMGLFSTAAYMITPDPKFGVFFYGFQAGTYAFQSNAKGDVVIFTRKFSLTVMDFVKKFCKLDESGHIDWDGCPPYIRLRWESGYFSDIIKMRHLILENPFYNPKDISLSRLSFRVQEYYWIEEMMMGLAHSSTSGFRVEAPYVSESKADRDAEGFDKFFGLDGFKYFPVICPRWSLPAGYSAGVDGPGDMALNAMIIYQQLEKDRLSAIEQLLAPPMIAPTSLKRHGASLLPRGISYIEDARMATAVIRPAYAVDPKIAELLMDLKSFESSIDTCFYKDVFKMFSGDAPTSHVTAVETNERISEKLSLMNPLLSQFDYDSGKMHEALIMIGQELGAYEENIPVELEDMSISVEYMSMLATASKASLMASIERGLNFSTMAAEAMGDPSVLKLWKADETIREYIDYTGTDPRLLRSEPEMIEVRKTMAQAEAEQAAMANELQASEIDKNRAQAQAMVQGRGSMLNTLDQASALG